MKTGLLMYAAVAVAAAIGLVVQQRPSQTLPHPVAARHGAPGDLFDSNESATENQDESLQGRAREVIDVAQYTYLRLDTKEGEVWAAVSKTPVSVGSEVTVENATRMQHFESATLARTFDVIYFGNLPTGAALEPSRLPPGHPAINGAAPLPATPPIPATQATTGVPDVEVPRASGSNAHTIGELFANSPKLEAKLVRVRGQVVKITPGVLGKTYLRLRDGSSARPEERELVVTSQAEPQLGAVATFEGTLGIQVDVGIGFRYPLLLADAKLITDDAARDPASGHGR
jgi:hypothetical protein